MKKTITALLLILVFVTSFSLVACDAEKESDNDAYSYSITEYVVERNGIGLHLDRTTANGVRSEKQILLVHGVTYSSHEFDVDYEDYSLARFLAREGYAVWKLDVAGYGKSDAVVDGFMPDSDYAAEDISAAVEYIVTASGAAKIDLLGWSWGTVTTSRYVAKRTERIDKLVLYAPILSGIGAYEVTDDFHKNSFDHAADDFQRDESGNFDHAVTDPVMIEKYASECYSYDGEYSPNGGRRDICVDKSVTLIDLSAIDVPTLVICGGNDPYLNYELVYSSIDLLPEHSRLKVIDGGAHAIMYEKPYYIEFRNSLIAFLNS